MESRSKVIEDMQRVLTYLDDADMKELFNRVIGKMRSMSDEEFKYLELKEAEQKGKMPYLQHQMHYRTEIIDTGNLLC